MSEGPIPAIPQRQPGPGARRVPVTRPQPSPSGPLAGNPISHTPRPALPPGISAAAAEHINTTGAPGAAPEAVKLHPSFSPLPAFQQTMRTHAEGLRRQLGSAVNMGQATLKTIELAMTNFKAVDPALLAAEGIDMERIGKFRDGLAALLALAQ